MGRGAKQGGWGQARVQGGPKEPAPPPLGIKKPKKKLKKRSLEQILSYFTYILLFFSRKYNFLSYFLSWTMDI